MKKITEQMLEIYKRFDGDIDGFIRIGTLQEKEVLPEKDFVYVSNILQSMRLIKKGLASKDFEEGIKIETENVCENQRVQNILSELL